MKYNNFFLFIFALALILISYATRSHLYNQIPFPGESTDEYSNTWVGLSLIKLGFPVGISGLANGYPSTGYRYINVDRILQSTANGTPVAINQPWFDHPATVGLITGGYSYLKGARVFEDTTISLIRKPLVYLGVISTLLVFVFSLLVFGWMPALISSLVYALSPYIIVTSRLAQAENVLIPFFLLSLIFHFLYQKTSQNRYFWLAVIASGLSLLTKLSGISVIAAGIILLMAANKPLKSRLAETVIFALTSLSFLLFYVVFGLAFSPSIFFQVLSGNSNRIYGIGANAIQQLITSSKVTNIRYFTDGWFLTGWLSLFGLSFVKNKQNRFVMIPVVCYLMTYLFFGSNPFGWYAYPFVPFLMIAFGVVIARSLKYIRFTPISTVLLLIPIGVAINQMLDTSVFSHFISLWRFGISLVLISSLISQITGMKKFKNFFCRFLIIGLFALALYIGFRYFSVLNINSWYHVT